MNFDRVLTLIETGVQDPSFIKEDYILSMVNECVEETSNMFNLPDLQAREVVTISAGEESVNMPATFARELYRVYNETSLKEVNIRSNVNVLEEMYDPTQSAGMVKDVAEYNGILWVKPKADLEQDLNLFFYRKPVPLDEDDLDDVDKHLDGIPNHLCQVVVDYCLMRLFTLIEDGIEGNKVNSLHYAGLYTAGLAKVEAYCKFTPKQKPRVRRSARFF